MHVFCLLPVVTSTGCIFPSFTYVYGCKSSMEGFLGGGVVELKTTQSWAHFPNASFDIVALEARILARLHFALNDTGCIFLGKAEMLLTHANLFTPRHLKFRIFTKVPKPHLRDRLLVLAQARDMKAGDRMEEWE
jgi:hypothetical protein